MMRNTERLKKLKAWVENELCAGRTMKAPAEDECITGITTAEPRCFLAWQPGRADGAGFTFPKAFNVCPSIVIMPNASYARRVEEKRFDRYNGVHRSQELGQKLAVSILFMIYEPGIRMPGFVMSEDDPDGINMDFLKDGTEDGLMTLMGWMDDCVEKLLGGGRIPETDLFVDDETMVRSLYADQSFVVDKRPIYYGFVNVEFTCYADGGVNSEVEKHLT